MQITLELPDPKYKVGDLLRVTRPTEGLVLVVMVKSISFDGVWAFNDARGTAAVATGGEYEVVIQSGTSTYRAPRPGRIYHYPVLCLDEGCYENGEPLVVEVLPPPEKVVPAEDPDDFFNLEAEWNAKHPPLNGAR